MHTRHAAIYVRVSTKRQDHRSQLPDLERWAEQQCEPVRWFRDKFTGKSTNRPGWRKLEADLRAGRISKLVCWRLDRLGRTARELLALFDELRQRHVDLICVVGGIMGLDTPEGRLLAGLVAQFAEYDNEVRSERIRAGQAVARANGKRWGGSKPGRQIKIDDLKARTIRQLRDAGESIAAIARTVGVSRPTVYAVLNNGKE